MPRRFQFRIRALLFAVLICALLVSSRHMISDLLFPPQDLVLEIMDARQNEKGGLVIESRILNRTGKTIEFVYAPCFLTARLNNWLNVREGTFISFAGEEISLEPGAEFPLPTIKAESWFHLDDEDHFTGRVESLNQPAGKHQPSEIRNGSHLLRLEYSLPGRTIVAEQRVRITGMVDE